MSSASDVLAVLQERLAAKLNLGLADITAGSRFDEDLSIDSLTAVELLMELEARYSVVITDDEAAGLSTVGQAAVFVAQHLSRDAN